MKFSYPVPAGRSLPGPHCQAPCSRHMWEPKIWRRMPGEHRKLQGGRQVLSSRGVYGFCPGSERPDLGLLEQAGNIFFTSVFVFPSVSAVFLAAFMSLWVFIEDMAIGYPVGWRSLRSCGRCLAQAAAAGTRARICLGWSALTTARLWETRWGQRVPPPQQSSCATPGGTYPWPFRFLPGWWNW